MSDPKRPLRGGWARRADFVHGVGRAEVYERKGLRVLSSRSLMEAPDESKDLLDTWLVSVSRRGSSMPADRDLERVRRDFGMTQAEEDNHESGNARKLFLVVDPARRVDCECKASERVVERKDGYRYTVPVEGTP
jgi:hypothetical protein